jgi:hypothetical protein
VRTIKNRYGSTDEVGVFEMHDDGMQVGPLLHQPPRGRAAPGGGCRQDVRGCLARADVARLMLDRTNPCAERVT